MSKHSYTIFLPLIIASVVGCGSLDTVTYVPNTTEYFTNSSGKKIPGIEAHERATGTVVSISSDQLFELGGCEFTKQAASYLAKALQFANQQQYKTMLIKGYTDNVAADEAQMNMTRSQAEAVASYFWSAGIPVKAMKVEGSAPSEYIGQQALSPKQLAGIRRVEISLLPQGVKK